MEIREIWKEWGRTMILLIAIFYAGYLLKDFDPTFEKIEKIPILPVWIVTLAGYLLGLMGLQSWWKRKKEPSCWLKLTLGFFSLSASVLTSFLLAYVYWGVFLSLWILFLSLLFLLLATFSFLVWGIQIARGKPE